MRPNRGFLLRNQKSEKIPNRFLKSILQNQKTNFPLSEIRYLKTKIQNPFEIRNQKSEMGNGKWELGIGNWEMGNGKSEFGNRKSEIRIRKSEFGNRKSEIGKSRKRNYKFEKLDSQLSLWAFGLGVGGWVGVCGR